MERLWLYLKRFFRMTKEMWPSHCIDVLTDALLHCSIRSTQRLETYNRSPLTIHRREKATKIWGV